MNSRRNFIKHTSITTTAFAMGILNCKDTSSNQTQSAMSQPTATPSLKISLAQWSLNRAFFANELDAKDFAAIAKNDYGIDAVEYVNGFYK